MSITKRISKFLLIAALAIPAWNAASAQKPTAPPENVATEVDAEKAMIAPVKIVSNVSADEWAAMSVEQRKDAAKPFKSAKLQNGAQPKILKVTKVTKTRADVRAGYSLITLNVAENPWTDGSGYQMLLDADHSTYGSTIPTSGALTSSGNASAATYAEFEYKIPENADGSLTTTNMIASGSQSITIPAGTYDWCITNPSPEDRVWIASTYGEIQGSYDDYVFESGFAYVFTISSIVDSGETHDQVSIGITSNYENPINLAVSNIYKDRAKLTWTPGGNETSWNVQYKNKGDYAWISAGTASSTNYNLEGLSALTDYQARVQGIYADGLSGWEMVTFTTTNDEAPLCDPEDMGEISYTLSDSYGDGWNGCSVKIVDHETGNVITTLTLSSGSSASGTVSLCYGRTVDFVWTKGSYAYETSFTITDPEGEVIYSSTDGSSLTDGDAFATYTMNMPVKPTNLAVSAVTYNSAKATWNGVTETYNLRYRVNGASGWTVVNNVTSPYTMIGLASETQYEVQVQGVLDGGVSNWTNSVSFTTLEGPTQSLDFGTVTVNSNETLNAKLMNESSSAVQATITVNPNPPFSVAGTTSTTVTLAANALTSIPVTFTPTEARNYNGTLTVVAGDVTTTIPLKGVGTMSGPEAIRDKEFFDGITYDWTDSEGSHTSKLSDVATKPEQIIAMLKKVYTDKTIPGNLKRGCDENGYFTEDWSDVSYPAIGEIKYTGTSGNTTQLQNPDYFEWDSSNSTGWGIDTKKDIVCGKNTYTGSSSTYTSYYATFDQTEYRPDNEGVTMLLVEMVDDYDRATYTAPTSTGEQYLKDVVSLTIKSVRIVTEAKRVGEGQSRGTLFNIDCDKMNKFFFLAKGQLRMPFNSKKAGVSSGSTTYYPGADFCPYPMYLYSSNYFGQGELNKFYDYNNSSPFFFQMFEQFSPVNNATGLNIDDLYSNLVKMTSFPVIHDCIDIPFAQSTSAQETDIHGHQFMMYGVESGAADCQDVRDLMFFVPDYRMMKWDDGSSNNDGRGSQVSCFHDYNQSHAPTMGLYVIQQDSVQALERQQDYFKLKLTWDSNMDDFLPDEKQEYQLYQVFTDEFGVSKWIPVYERNAQGLYKNATTGEWQTDTIGAKPVVLIVDPSNTKKTYSEVYELRENSGRMVTYAVRGQDEDHFLSLQMSNEESYFIPGKDPAEMALMSSATVYSRYEAQNENNCYSNKIQIKSSPRTIKSSYLTNGNTMTINRSYSKLDENNETVTVTEPVATLTINTSGKYFTVTGSVVENQASVKSLFPVGTHDGKTAGYHANNLTNNRISYTTETYNNTTYINFDINLWDNFVANVSKNEHPGMYTYQLRFNTAVPFQGLTGSTSEAYSNPYRVYVYKTDSKVNEPLTLAQVQGDTGCSDDYTPGDVEFSAQVMLSSKSEILRYDAYRWNEGATRSIIYDGGNTDEDEDDVDPTGMAGNQGATYTVSMNAVGTADYYKGDEVPVTATAPQNWATFVDYYPAKQANGGAFTYAPVVELFTRGYVEGSTTEERGDYNTYGGPLKTTAVGKMELEIPDNLNTAGNPFMSTYKWFDGTNWCAYYKIPVKFHALGIPEGYEIYKIRAWRDVDTNILREELSDHQDRIAANYLFEDLTYGDALGDGHTMSKENLFQNNDGTINSYELGRRAIGDPDPQSENYTGETHATFGALRINTKDDQPYAIEDLSATIKVRAYFTKTSNPILSDPIYVIANSGNGWDYDTPLATLTCEDGANFTGTITISAANDGSGKGYFMFSKQLGSSWTNNPQYIFGPDGDGNKVLGEWPNNAGYNLKYWQGGTKVFEVYPGTYQLSIGSHVQDLATSADYGYQAGYITITRVANSKAPTRDLVPADYGYYVAEGSIEFNSNMFNEIITGVTDVKMEANREVMSVSYVNTLGQVSSTPWQGVNVVVVRYTDGSTSTSKVIK